METQHFVLTVPTHPKPEKATGTKKIDCNAAISRYYSRIRHMLKTA